MEIVKAKSWNQVTVGDKGQVTTEGPFNMVAKVEVKVICKVDTFDKLVEMGYAEEKNRMPEYKFLKFVVVETENGMIGLPYGKAVEQVLVFDEEGELEICNEDFPMEDFYVEGIHEECEDEDEEAIVKEFTKDYEALKTFNTISHLNIVGEWTDDSLPCMDVELHTDKGTVRIGLWWLSQEGLRMIFQAEVGHAERITNWMKDTQARILAGDE